MTWRYIAQRALTGEWLDWDIPLSRDELTWALSGPGSLRGTVTPDVGRLRGPDGRPLLDEWGTLLYAEADGEIRWGGIVVRSEFNGAAWAVEASGFTSYPAGLPFGGNISAVGIDPADAFRAIWSYVQTNEDGNLGLVIDPTTTPVRLGKPAEKAYQEVQIGGDWVPKSSVPASQIIPNAAAKLKDGITASATSLTLLTIGDFDKIDAPYFVTIGSETVRVAGRSGKTLTGLTRGYGSSSAAPHNAGTYVRFTGGTPERTAPAKPAEPYALAWWDAADCGSELGKLAQETPFDFAEEHTWAGDEVAHRLRIGYPRLGRRRDDLAFEQGVNIVAPVVVQRDGGEFANAIHGLGAGEGRKVVVTDLVERDGRLRRTAVFTDKTITTTERLTALARAELATRRNVVEIESVEVANHPHAPIGSWALGDDVLIRAYVPWLGDVAIWHRIVGWSMTSDDRAALSLRRSDAFTYAGRPE
ncbi:hypothetical protein GA0070616_4606 [Micromonospora nigra]|uniref:Minor tail protein n=1 Tax=Micromonospora nigra TaxID=145857 RepID=A0A1C6SU49_9ACTN|nr:hypothetical protein [Micromonospora nigra]SCL32988.1 hypothetical protein GA0070616_4606 [Micromonospora nigra]